MFLPNCPVANSAKKVIKLAANPQARQKRGKAMWIKMIGSAVLSFGMGKKI